MGVQTGDNKLVKARGPKTFHFDLPKDAGVNLKNEIYSIIKHNELLAEHIIKNEIRQLFSKYNHGNHIHENRNSKTIESQKLVLNLLQRLDLEPLINMLLFKTCLFITPGKI